MRPVSPVPYRVLRYHPCSLASERYAGAVDVEWAVASGERFTEAFRIVEVRPETVESRRPAAPVVPCL